ncbi:MAG: 50S ribosomal protein L24 [Christensenellales bacterium]|jgi:large subunit ribosomal protein L24
MSSFNVKKGDYAMIIAGKDKGKPCMVVGIDTSSGRALVEGKNLETVIKKSVKARKASDRSGIIEQPGTIDISNLMPICAACGSPTRVRNKEVDGKKQRICAKCDAVLVTKRPTEKKTKAKATVRRKSAATSAEEVAETTAPANAESEN